MGRIPAEDEDEKAEASESYSFEDDELEDGFLEEDAKTETDKDNLQMMHCRRI